MQMYLCHLLAVLYTDQHQDPLESLITKCNSKNEFQIALFLSMTLFYTQLRNTTTLSLKIPFSALSTWFRDLQNTESIMINGYGTICMPVDYINTCTTTVEP